MYRARQDSVGREVALKIDTRALESERDRRRFLREAEAAGRMSGHPNVVNIYDAGVTEDNHPYLVMELCTGGSYASRLRERGPLPPAEVRELGVRIADALHAAHQAGVLHRDVKPGNILLNRYGVPGLADFGLAALPDPSRELSVTIEALTPAYAPPEVYRMEAPTPYGDQFSLAASLYALLSGRPPRWPDTGTPSLATMVRILDEPIPDIPGVPEDLSAVLRKAMSAEAEDRYGSLAEFRDALAGLTLGGTSLALGALGTAGTYPVASTLAGGGDPSSGPASGPPVSGAAGYPVSAPPVYPVSGPSGSSGYQSVGPAGFQQQGYQQPGQTSAPPGHPASGPPGYRASGPPGHPASGPPGYPAPGQAPSGGPFATPGYGPPPGYLSGPGGPGKQGKSGSRTPLIIGGVVLVVLLLIGAVGAAALTLGGDDNDRPSQASSSGGYSSEGPATDGPATASGDAGTPSPDSSGDVGFPFDIPTGGSFSRVCDALGAIGIAGAKCPGGNECWEGATGASAQSVSCTGPHTWETYVVGSLADSSNRASQSRVRADANVLGLCSPNVFEGLKSVANVPAGTWRVAVLGPKAAGKSGNEFRCVASQGQKAHSKPSFG